MSIFDFCPDCSMLKKNCICDNSKSNNYDNIVLSEDEVEKSNKNLFSFNKKKSEDAEEYIPQTYAVDEHKLSDDRIAELKNEYPNIYDTIIENFPFNEPRMGQLQIIQDIVDAIEKGYKYIILEAGTGTGKSVVAATLSRIYESSYILTMTKQLQSQYHQDFDFPMVKGRGNFYCLQDSLDSTCDIGTCKTTPTSSKFFCQYGVAKNPTLDGNAAFQDAFGGEIFYNSPDHCHYWHQKSNSINSPITLMNYDYAILELNYVKHFPPRSLLILDEAHNIEDKLMRTMEVNLYNRRLEKDIKKVISNETLKNGETEDWILELEAIYDSYKDIDIKELPKNKAERINSTIFNLKQIKENLEKEPSNWVIDSDEHGVSFKPLRVHHYAKDYLFNHGDVCIFLSATVLSHKMFSKWLGLNPNEVYHMKVDSPFDEDKRPVELKLAGKMSANRIKQTAPKTIGILKEILDKHKGDKGLIHCHSYKCQNYITKNFHNSRIISHGSTNRESVLNYFENDKNPLVLVSPSMNEGVDLPYDKCRFQVIYKMPFPYLGDKQVNLRRKKDQRWYAYKTVMNLMQAYGRGMRAEDDYCYTYIIDSDINMLFSSPLYKSLIPQYFKDAIL